MEPRWRDDWCGMGHYLGGVGNFDLWRIGDDIDTEHLELRVAWGPSVRDWNHLTVKWGGTELKLYYNEDGDPTTEELVLIHRYLVLFVPELGLTIGEDNEA